MKLFGLSYSNLNYCITAWGASNKSVTNPLQTNRITWLKQFLVPVTWIALDHYLILWKYLILKIRIIIRFAFIFENIFQEERIFLYAMKVNTMLDKLKIKFSMFRIHAQLKLCNLLHTLVIEYSTLFPLTLEDSKVSLPYNTGWKHISCSTMVLNFNIFAILILLLFPS